jgi:hypothetical protein
MASAAERRAARKRLRENVGDEEPKKTLARDADAPEPGSSPEAPPPSSTRSRDIVIVACKVPNGLILQNHRMIDDFEPVFGGGSRPIRKAEKLGDPIHIIGPARSINADPEAKRVISGFALTYNVPKAAFEQWMKDNAQLDVVKNRMIWAYDNEHKVSDAAKDLKGLRSGLEAINTESKKPDGSYVDPRMSKQIRKLNPDDDRPTMIGR